MAKPNVLIFRTAGTNCDKETEFAFKAAGAKTELDHINIIKKKKDFSSYQIICIPGGFSYGDDLGAGKIFSLEIILWLKDKMKNFIYKGGLILGVCNGFQVLVRSGILPNLNFNQSLSLIENDSGRFEDRWVQLKIDSGSNCLARKIWFKQLPELIYLPVAHAEGKLFCKQNILNKIKNNNQIALRYSSSKGNEVNYPDNPNGSLDNIAGILDQTGRVLGLMPHPERFIFQHQYPYWQKEKKDPYGFSLFKNSVDYFR
ncbi:MAG: phosphoribosylformylglycinamidine synthase I [Candidatus Omnitrophica bacterium]|nr:phosphoribosylformylglycinamidine synthase I [Candidatus Omnitrophota bacterium]MCF7887416.1 phosphoribosylformylglycinamidine synthase I [Candidatus Omnitrophota bacterium]